MTLTRADVMRRLSDLDTELQAMTREDTHPAERYVRAKREWERQFAETYLQQEGTVKERESKTIVKLYTAGVYKNYVNAEAAYEGWAANFRVVDKRVSVGQSLLKAFEREGDTHGVQPSWSVREGAAA